MVASSLSADDITAPHAVGVLIALAAAVLGVLLTALFNLNNKVDALKQQVEELAGKAAVPPAPPEEKAK